MGTRVQEVLPKAGLVYSEKSSLSEILNKPKILPLKSITLERIVEMEERARKIFEDSRLPPGSSQVRGPSLLVTRMHLEVREDGRGGRGVAGQQHVTSTM